MKAIPYVLFFFAGIAFISDHCILAIMILLINLGIMRLMNLEEING